MLLVTALGNCNKTNNKQTEKRLLNLNTKNLSVWEAQSPNGVLFIAIIHCILALPTGILGGTDGLVVGVLGL